MRNLGVILVIVLMSNLVFGQTQTENYILNTNYKIPTLNGNTYPGTNLPLSDEDKNEFITYFDGLGRAKQSIAKHMGGQKENIVTPIAYDNFGRQDKNYLSLSNSLTDGFELNFLSSDVIQSVKNFYLTKFPLEHIANKSNPYFEKKYEASPLNRVRKMGAPGKDWKLNENAGTYDRAVDYDWQTNETNEVKLFTVFHPNGDTEKAELNFGGYYPEAELFKEITMDEMHIIFTGKDHSVETFKDKQGREVLKRTFNNQVAHDTYYVYDDFGNLTFVLSPEGSDKILNNGNLVQVVLDELCYQYRYDYRNRLIEKKIPGRGWEYIVYNSLNLPILTQDANLKAQNKWLFKKYDPFGRIAYTGEITEDISRAALQVEVDNTVSQTVSKQTSFTTIDGTKIYYDNGAYPTINITDILTINYYDNYTFDGFVHMPALYDGQAILNHDNAPGTQKWTKGLVTGSKVRVLDQTPAKWITTYTGYDAKGRPIFVRNVNDYLGTVDVVKSTLDFIGAINKTVSTHTKNGMVLETKDVFLYDHTGRMVTHTQELNNKIEVIVENTYDDLGQLMAKGVGGKSSQGRLQNIDFTYNIRGWLKQINDIENLGNKLFALKMNYNQNAEGTGVSPAVYNGNISQTIWRTSNDNTKRSSAYRYDALNRITDAYYRKADVSGFLNQEEGRYDLYGVEYDKNGNISTLKRNGHTAVNGGGAVTSYGVMDNLTYDYHADSNKLVKVTDAILNAAGKGGFDDLNKTGNDYTYDVNGNMIKDLNKGISSIVYNYLNLPKLVSFGNGNISYIYDATGAKLSKKVVEPGKSDIYTYYAGNYVYAGSSLKFFNHPEGYVDAENGFGYVYQYKDHLGNIRLSYKDVSLTSTPSLEIQEENNYYPFGLKHKGYNNAVNGTEYNHKRFLGQEMNKELGLNWLTFRYRNYMPEIGRFFGVDPVSEDYMSISTYQFAHNNPIWKIELEGLEGIPVNGMDQLNREPVTGHTGVGSAIPIGDSTAGNYGTTYQTLSAPAGMTTGYPGESLDNLVTAGVQWIASNLTGSDVSPETAGYIEMGADAIILVSSKGKSGVKNVLKSVDDGIEFTADISKSKATTRSGHRNAGNKQLNEAMQKDPVLKEKMEKLDPNAVENTSRSVKSGNKTATRKNPEGYEWDHNTNNKNQLDLRSKSNHQQKTSKDQGGKGGWWKFWE